MLTKTQEEALRLLKTGANVFLTGKAGTGKSFVLKEFIRQSKKKILITAPTGVAAIEIGGATLHRTFDIPLNMAKLVKDVKVYKPSKNPVVAADIVIIDEISMVRRDVFEYVMRYIKEVNWKYRKGKAPIQVILVGDFFQLPPVLTPGDVEAYQTLMGNLDIYPFESPYWWQFDFQKIELLEVMRQKDDGDFLDNLNRIRNGDVSAIDYFNKRVREDYKTTKGINIVPTNAKVRKINNENLLRLNTKKRVYKAEKYGAVKPSDIVNDEELLLKIGAKVMITTNHPMLEYSNGSLGTVKEFHKDSVDVQLLGSHKVVEIERKRNVISEYVVEDGLITLREVGFYSQIPLKIAYAITVHKSQGKTFDEVHLDPSVWSDGQLYVALSRVTSIDGLTLSEPIQSSAVKVSEDVLRFYGYEIGEDANVEEIERRTREEVITNFGVLESIITAYLKSDGEGEKLLERFPNVANLEEVLERLKDIKPIIED